MKILRFDDDRVGVLNKDNKVVDISGAIDYRKEKGPKRVIEEVIEEFALYRGKKLKIFAKTPRGFLSTE